MRNRANLPQAHFAVGGEIALPPRFPAAVSLSNPIESRDRTAVGAALEGRAGAPIAR